jgi:hypothetical protein
MRRLGRAAVAVILIVLPAAALYLIAEGLYAVTRGREPGQSLGYQGFALVKEAIQGQEAEVPGDPNAATLDDRGEIEALLDRFTADAVGLGNTPYRELRTDEASIQVEVDGCTRQKSNLRKKETHLLTRLFDPLDPIVAFWDADRQLDPEVRRFIERYRFREVVMTTNRFGDRVTVPDVARERKVIIAGDSVANGVLLNDDETLASQMQALDSERQYINTGIAGAPAADVICAIDAAQRNYGGRFDELIYLYSENDFQAGEPYGTPEEVVAWLKQFARRHEVGRVTLVFAPYFYNIVPQLSRFKGYRGHFFPRHAAERRRIAEAAAAAGFRYLDYGEIALEENRRAGTMFAAFALFVDAAHYSRYGTSRLVERLRAE